MENNMVSASFFELDERQAESLVSFVDLMQHDVKLAIEQACDCKDTAKADLLRKQNDNLQLIASQMSQGLNRWRSFKIKRGRADFVRFILKPLIFALDESVDEVTHSYFNTAPRVDHKVDEYLTIRSGTLQNRKCISGESFKAITAIALRMLEEGRAER